MKTISTLCAAVVLSFLTCSCGTVTPNSVTDDEFSEDSSTPPQYSSHNSGFIRLTHNDLGEVDGAIITPNAHNEYNFLISQYRYQLSQTEHVLLEQDQGVTPFEDEYKNKLFFMKAEYTTKFLLMDQMSKDRVAPDSVWLKLKAIVQ